MREDQFHLMVNILTLLEYEKEEFYRKAKTSRHISDERIQRYRELNLFNLIYVDNEYFRCVNPCIKSLHEHLTNKDAYALKHSILINKQLGELYEGYNHLRSKLNTYWKNNHRFDLARDTDIKEVYYCLAHDNIMKQINIQHGIQNE